METHRKRVQHYRELANEMRMLAGREHNPEIRMTMMSLAEKYDELLAHLNDLDERLTKPD